MQNERVKEMTLAGIFGAIILFMSLVPAPWGLPWGYIPVAGISITIIHIVVIIGAIFSSKRVAVFLGFMFGLGSLLAAVIFQPPEGLLFINPFVSIVPRMLFGYFIYLFYELLTKYIANKAISMGLTFFLSTLAHTVLVLTMIYLISRFNFYTDTFTSIFGNQGFIQFFIAVIGLNSVIEILLAVLVGTPIGLRIKEYRQAGNTNQ